MKRLATRAVLAALLCSTLSSCIVVSGRRGCRSSYDIGPAIVAVGALIHAIGHRCH